MSKTLTFIWKPCKKDSPFKILKEGNGKEMVRWDAGKLPPAHLHVNIVEVFRIWFGSVDWKVSLCFSFLVMFGVKRGGGEQVR